jgi:hypothetical protein
VDRVSIKQVFQEPAVPPPEAHSSVEIQDLLREECAAGDFSTPMLRVRYHLGE